MRKIDLSKYEIRTDLVKDIILKTKTIKDLKETLYDYNGINVSRVRVINDISKVINKKRGIYTTISFKDAADNDEFNNIKDVLIKELKYILNREKIKTSDKALIVGLGNIESTPDSLGPKVIKNIVVTKHIYDLTRSLEKPFRIVSAITPGVMGTTGIETSLILEGIIEKTNPDFIIAVDSLACNETSRLAKTIQISNSGIHPGSGVGNKRKELSKDLFGIPVIAIGIPFVLDAISIVSESISYFTNENIYLKKLNSKKKNSSLCKTIDFLNYNLMVTPKEVDFLIDNLSKLISESINEVIHDI